MVAVMTTFASYVWLFLSSLYEVCSTPIYTFFGGYANYVIDNPFNSNTWSLDFDFVISILQWDKIADILERLNVPNVSLFGAFLFTVALVWGFGLFVSWIASLFN